MVFLIIKYIFIVEKLENTKKGKKTKPIRDNYDSYFDIFSFCLYG